MAADQGRFVLARSDHLSTVLDKPGVNYIVGRSGSLTPFQQLQSKYVSREQLCFVWNPPSLFVHQAGKNPTFLGPECAKVPLRGEPPLEFKGSADITEPQRSVAADGHTVVLVPLCDPMHATTAPPLTQTDAATFYFPTEVGLPCIAVRCERTRGTAAESREGANAATSSLSTAQMLAVPTLGASGGNSEEDEQEESETKRRRTDGSSHEDGRSPAEGSGGGGSKPEWQGLLDAAMQQTHRQDAAEKQQQEERDAEATPSRPSAPLPPAPAPTPIPVSPPPPPPRTETTAQPLAEQTRRPSPPPPTNAPTPVVAPAAQRMGFWEWKCHANGPDRDPKSWRKYPLAVAKMLEEAYRAKKVTVAIPDSLLLGGGGGGRKHNRDGDGDDTGKAGGEDSSTYSVCFKEDSLDGGMIQYQNDDKGKFRVVRRTGGDDVDYSGVKAARIIPQSSSSDEDSDSDSDDDDFSESESESISSSSSSESEDKRRKRKAQKKTRK